MINPTLMTIGYCLIIVLFLYWLKEEWQKGNLKE